MFIVILEIWGKVRYAECKTRKEADEKVAPWLEEARKAFPNAEFHPKFYQGEKLPLDASDSKM